MLKDNILYLFNIEVSLKKNSFQQLKKYMVETQKLI